MAFDLIAVQGGDPAFKEEVLDACLRQYDRISDGDAIINFVSLKMHRLNAPDE
jgi:hypothetical protein